MVLALLLVALSILFQSPTRPLRLLKMVEDGLHGRNRVSGGARFDEATWDGDIVLRMHQEPGIVP